MRLASWVFASIGFAMATPAAAEICYSPTRSGLTTLPPTSTTVFTCPIAGNGTLAQLAAAGWEVVKLSPIVVANGPGFADVADQLVLRRAVRVHRDGFE